MANELGKIQITTDKNMTVAGEPYQVKRGWVDRLFTRPWTPLKATRTAIPQVPSKEVLRFGDRMVMHPEIYMRLLREFPTRSL